MRSREKYNKIPNDKLIQCNCCGKKYTKDKFELKHIWEDEEHAIRCSYCDWLKRHNNIIPIIDGWSEEEIKLAIKFLLLNDSPYINDLESIYSNHTLTEICNLVISLKINGKKRLVKTTCEFCGKDIDMYPSVYLITQHPYCSTECYWKDKPLKMPRGADSQFYNRIETECANCHKPLYIPPNQYNRENEFGDHFNFCNHQCYWEFRARYYVGEKGSRYGAEYTDEQRERARINILKNSRSAKRFDSGIQLSINDLLEQNNIEYKREEIFKYYAVDNYLPNENLIIEVMGDYWHSNPLRYNTDKYQLNEMQARGIVKDKQKHSYILNHENIEILYLWETDINNNLELCKNLILKYVETNGKLENYHSFNYFLDKNRELHLRNNIIVPYQDMSIDEYRHLIKEKKIS